MNDTISFPIKVTNPGHFFACCGILKAADSLFDTATGCFTDDDKFTLKINDVDDPLKAVIGRILPSKKEELKDLIICDDRKKSDTAIFLNTIKIRIDFWNHFDDRPEMKLFAGRQKAYVIIEGWLEHLWDKRNDPLLSDDPFKISVHHLPSGFDSSTAWNALDVGFSLNEIDKLNKKIETYPIVEFFAPIGIQSYVWNKNRKDNTYDYNLWFEPLSISVAKAIACGALSDVKRKHFKFSHKKNGQTKILKEAKEISIK